MRVSRLKLILGLLILGVGILYLLGEIGYPQPKEIITKWWPAVIAVIGIIGLMCRKSWFFNALLVLFGGLMLVKNLYPKASMDMGDVLFYSIIILIGLTLVIKGFGLDARFSRKNRIYKNQEGFLNDSSKMPKYDVIFGERRIRNESDLFTGANISATFGTIYADFSNVKIQPGQTAVIKASCSFGTVDVKIPTNSNVTFSGSPVFADFKNNLKYTSFDDNAPKFHFDYDAAFGEIKISD